MHKFTVCVRRYVCMMYATITNVSVCTRYLAINCLSCLYKKTVTQKHFRHRTYKKIEVSLDGDSLNHTAV